MPLMPPEAELTTDRTPATGPKPLPPSVDVPESRSYRFKTKLLGPPLATERLAHERLGIPTALAVFSSDCISSSAYATEQILTRLIPVIGILAFSLVVPITVSLLVVLFFLILSYRETIKEYPTAGGAYMVTRDNFGLLPAQVAGVALLTDYVLTVAVSTAAGTDALTSAVPVLTPYHLIIALSFVGLLAFGNLKGVKESGRIFAAPTYFFIVMMGLMIIMGIVKAAGGALHPQNINHLKGTIPIGHQGNANLVLLRRRPVRRPQGLRLGRRRRHRRRGHLQRRHRLPAAGVAERPQDARDHGRRPRRAVPRPVVPLDQDPPDPVHQRLADGDLPGRQERVRHRRRPARASSTCSRPAPC